MKKEKKTRSDFNFVNGECYKRMNYLLKLSLEFNKSCPSLSRTYTKMMKNIAKRNALRLYNL